jgi:hypothetical protein
MDAGLEIAGMNGVALIRLVPEARANGRAARVLEEARRRSEQERARRTVAAMARRDPLRGGKAFARLQEEMASR